MQRLLIYSHFWPIKVQDNIDQTNWVMTKQIVIMVLSKRKMLFLAL